MKRLVVFLILIFSLSLRAQIKVDTNFENANARVYRINSEKNEIYFTPELKKNQTTRCWFYFKVWNFKKFLPLKIYEINYEDKLVPSYPVYSTDRKHWKKIKAQAISNNVRLFRIPAINADTIYFAAGYPYTYSDLMNYIRSVADNPYIDTSSLTISEGGLQVPLLAITDTSVKGEKDMVWIIARQHAFETPANYCTEGLINFLLGNDLMADSFRRSCIAYIVPMVDVDNVFHGRSGRLQNPVDFNRDWRDDPHWNAIRELISMIETSAEIYDFRIFMDIHATFPGTDQPVFAYFNIFPEDSPQYENIHQFWMIFSTLTNIIPQEVNDYSQENYADRYIAMTYPYIDFATTLECDWNLTEDYRQWSPQMWRNTGSILAKTLAIYLTKQKAK